MQRLSVCGCHPLPVYLNTPFSSSSPSSSSLRAPLGLLLRSLFPPFLSTISPLLHFPRSIYPSHSHPSLSTSFLFLQRTPSSLPCLLQQKSQHRHQHVCVCTCVRCYGRSTSGASRDHERRRRWHYFLKKPCVCVERSDQNIDCWCVTSQPRKQNPLKSLEERLSSCLPLFPLVSVFLLLSLSHLSHCISTSASHFFPCPILSPSLSSPHKICISQDRKTKRFCHVGQDTFRKSEGGGKNPKWSGSQRCLTYSAGILDLQREMGLRSPTNRAGVVQPLKWIPPTTCSVLCITPKWRHKHHHLQQLHSIDVSFCMIHEILATVTSGCGVKLYIT